MCMLVSGALFGVYASFEYTRWLKGLKRVTAQQLANQACHKCQSPYVPWQGKLTTNAELVEYASDYKGPYMRYQTTVVCSSCHTEASFDLLTDDTIQPRHHPTFLSLKTAVPHLSSLCLSQMSVTVFDRVKVCIRATTTHQKKRQTTKPIILRTHKHQRGVVFEENCNLFFSPLSNNATHASHPQNIHK